MKKLLALALALLMASAFTTAIAEDFPEVFKSGSIKIAVIRNDGSSDHCSQMFQGAVERGTKFGFQVDTMITNSDDVKFQDLVQQCIESGYDGLFITHGKQDYAYELVQKVVDAGIPIVTFDTLPFNAEGKIPVGVTVTQQDDHSLARDSLDALIKYCKEEKGIDVPKIITNFYGPGVPPLDRRNEILVEYVAAGKVELVDTVVATDPSNYIGDFQNKFAAMLNKYPPGSFDAFWSVADVYCQGCYLAAEDVGRLGEFPFFSIDASTTDMEYMRAEGSSWMTCSAVDASLIGDVCVRILAMKMAGEETPDNYDFSCQTFWQADLKPDTNIVNLVEVVEGWGISNDFFAPWMDALEAHVASK
jgi:simple sugar transport system substrate-binding protein